MKDTVSFVVPVFCLFFAIVPGARATDFIPVNQADVLVITHTELRTPGWVPDMIGAWETELLLQKETQGYTVALFEIQDGINQYFIRDYLVNNQGSFQFVYILGEARRPENDIPPPFMIPFANFSNGNIVPIWREVVDSFMWGSIVVEYDRGYLQDIPGVYVGRLPAASRQEILDYLSKSSSYLALEGQSPPWSEKILQAINDVTNFFNGSSGSYVQAFYEAWENEFAPGWPVDILAISTGPSTPEERALLLEDHLNDTHYGLMHVNGTSGAPYLLADWYYGNSLYNFTNSGYLPFMLGMSCEIGGFDHYIDGVERECVVEKMILHPDGGIIASIAPTGATILQMNCVYAMSFWNVIFSESYINFGQILNRSIDVATGAVPIADFTLKMMVLLGDPTLNLPYGAFPQGRWTEDISPVIINKDFTIEAGTELIIEPGVEVRFADGVNFIVEGILTCQGTSPKPVKMVRQDGVTYWGGIDVLPGGHLNFSYGEISYASNGIVAENASYISVSNSTIQNWETYGIQCQNVNQPLIDSCNFEHCGLKAIDIIGGDPSISECNIKGSDFGITYQGGGEPVLTGNSLVGISVGTSASQVAIKITRYGASDTPKPTIIDNVDSLFNYGLQLLYCPNDPAVVIKGNKFRKNEIAGLIIAGDAPVIGGSYASGEYNDFSDNKDWGISIGSGNPTIRSNAIKRNGKYGVRAYLSANPNLGDPLTHGNNSIWGYSYDGYNSTLYTISAVGNYWGAFGTPNVYGMWDTRSPLLIDPYILVKPQVEDIVIPREFKLYVNYPNPFNPNTTISFDLPKEQTVKIEIFNVLGQSVRILTHELYPAGSHNIIWDSSDSKGKQVSSGIYFYKLSSGDFNSSRKMTLLR